MLRDADAPVLLTQERLTSRLPATAARLLCVDTNPMLDRQSTDNPAAAVHPESLAYVIYTSGSTGQPKAAMIAHRNLASLYGVWREVYQLDRVSRHLQMASCSFDVFTADLIRSQCSGQTLVLAPREWLLLSERLYALMRQESIDFADFVPAVMRPLIEHLERTEQDLRFMRVVTVGSDIWYTDEHQRLRRCCGPDVRVINAYGLTEATVDSAWLVSDSDRAFPGHAMPIGRPAGDLRTYILDANVQPVPIGVTGELFVGGPGVGRGYRGRPAQTASRFVPNPFAGAAGGDTRLYRTGDAARAMADGTIQLLGRIDRQAKVGGYRIEPGEIEAVLRQHPAVRDCAVLPHRAEGMHVQLIAYVQPATGTAAEGHQAAGELSAALRRHVRATLPEYMTPAAFVTIDAMPLSPNGKVDRSRLPRFEEPAASAPATPVSARDSLEQRLCRILEQVLGRKQVGPEDNFFEIGGDSILSIQLVAKARQAGLHFTARQLFEHQTIRALAAVLVDEPRAQAESGGGHRRHPADADSAGVLRDLPVQPFQPEPDVPGARVDRRRHAARRVRRGARASRHAARALPVHRRRSATEHRRAVRLDSVRGARSLRSRGSR